MASGITLGEITVVGGGIFGLACAWELARRGARVRLIEAGPGAKTFVLAAGATVELTGWGACGGGSSSEDMESDMCSDGESVPSCSGDCAPKGDDTNA